MALVVAASGAGWWAWSERDHRARVAAWRAAWDELRAKGEPVALEDLNGPPIPDAENGARLFEGA